MLHHLTRFVPIADKIIPRKTSLPILHYICVHKSRIVATDLETTLVMKVDDKRSYLLPFNILKTVFWVLFF